MNDFTDAFDDTPTDYDGLLVKYREVSDRNRRLTGDLNESNLEVEFLRASMAEQDPNVNLQINHLLTENARLRSELAASEVVSLTQDRDDLRARNEALEADNTKFRDMVIEAMKFKEQNTAMRFRLSSLTFENEALKAEASERAAQLAHEMKVVADQISVVLTSPRFDADLLDVFLNGVGTVSHLFDRVSPIDETVARLKLRLKERPKLIDAESQLCVDPESEAEIMNGEIAALRQRNRELENSILHQEQSHNASAARIRQLEELCNRLKRQSESSDLCAILTRDFRGVHEQ
jgi:SMC interacting uncharacterized protein involved in chromosome segregation